MRRTNALALAFVALVTVGAAGAAPADRVLVVADAETGERYLTTTVDDGTRVALEYTHSVEQSRVYEEYAVRGDRLEQTRMAFKSYGWGLPSGANVTLENGTYVYDPPGSLERLTVAPGRIAGHELHVGDHRFDLVGLSDGRSVDVYLTRGSARAADAVESDATAAGDAAAAGGDTGDADTAAEVCSTDE